jgi:hypothetical protein
MKKTVILLVLLMVFGGVSQRVEAGLFDGKFGVSLFQGSNLFNYHYFGNGQTSQSNYLAIGYHESLFDVYVGYLTSKETRTYKYDNTLTWTDQEGVSGFLLKGNGKLNLGKENAVILGALYANWSGKSDLSGVKFNGQNLGLFAGLQHSLNQNLMIEFTVYPYLLSTLTNPSGNPSREDEKSSVTSSFQNFEVGMTYLF